MVVLIMFCRDFVLGGGSTMVALLTLLQCRLGIVEYSSSLLSKIILKKNTSVNSSSRNIQRSQVWLQMERIIFFSHMKIVRNEYALHLLKLDLGASHLPKLDQSNSIE